jgi:glycine dehydrogenase
MSQNTPSLRELEHHNAFVERHIGPNDAEIAQMLDVVGHASLDAMTDAIVPAKIKSPAPLALPESMTEVQALAKIRRSPTRTPCCAASSARATTVPTRRT